MSGSISTSTNRSGAGNAPADPPAVSSNLDFFFIDFGSFIRCRNRPGFRWPVSMNRNGEPHDAAILSIDVVASVYAKKFPTAPLDRTGEVAAGNLYQTAYPGCAPCPRALAFDVNRQAALDRIPQMRSTLPWCRPGLRIPVWPAPRPKNRRSPPHVLWP